MSSKAVLGRTDGRKGAIVIEGYLKKLKTMKKKYFVLRGESSEASARLEYYDSEKKYRLGVEPKRMISLKTCFNINRRTDTKQKHVIALYTKDDVFCVVLETEKMLEDWLKLLLKLQCGEEVVDGEPLRPYFEHVWKVNLQDKGLGDSRKLVGLYYVCLSEQTLSLVKCAPNGDEKKEDVVEFPLTNIRRCGGTGSFFFIEVGRQCVTGAGELWMLTPDANIAKNMNDVILSAFTLRQNADPHRKRSCSNPDANRPNILQRRQTHGGSRPLHASPYSAIPVSSCLAPPYHQRVPPAPRSGSQRRHSVSAVSSSAAVQPVVAHDVVDGVTGTCHQRTKSCPLTDANSVPLIVEPADGDRRGIGVATPRRPQPSKSSTGTRERSDSMPSRNRTTSEGTHKIHTRPSSVHMRGLSYSPPGPCSTDSAGSSSLSIDEPESDRYAHPATPDERVILEENSDDALLWPNDDPELRFEELDECTPMNKHPTSLPIYTSQNKLYSSASHGSPHSSFPTDYLQMSPADSGRRTRPSTSPSQSDYLPMSPAESSRRILPSTSPGQSDYLPMSPAESHRRVNISSSPSYADYLLMSPGDAQRRVPVGSNSATDYLPMSPPGDKKQSAMETTSSSTTSTSGYITMSPIDSRPTKVQSSSMDYLPMSPGESSARMHSHSRGASLVEEDGYVPMAPHHSDDGYVDMEPVSAHRFISDDHHSDMSPGSSCSVTSGTPSTDHHYLLEKVSSYFTPSEEEDGSTTDRPARTYSFGSQPKGRLEVMNAAEAARVRAFSVGTRPRNEVHKLTARVAPTNTKFSSAPLLSSSWSGSSRHPAHDPMSDLMEIDFRKKRSSRFKGLPNFEGLSAPATSSADSGYMDMSSKSPPRASPPKPNTSKHLFSPPEGKMSARLIKPAIISSYTLKTIGEKPDIQKFPTSSSANINILPNKLQAPDKPYVEMKGGRLTRSGSEGQPEGYMNMSFGSSTSKLTRKSSSESVSEYLSRSCGKSSSQPIEIRGPAAGAAMARKSSSTTPPKPPSFLQLGVASVSLNPLSVRKNPKRKGRKKQERRGSKENATTPTADFPLLLNSPLSPKKCYPDDSDENSAIVAAETTTEAEGVNLAVPLDRVLRICSKENSPMEATDVPEEEEDYALMRPGVPSQRKTPTDFRLVSGRPPSSPRPPDKPPEPDRKRLAPLAKPEDIRVKAGPSGTDISEPHAGVSRQVSTSSSSSTEVMSVKESNEGDITYASLDLASESEEPRSPRPSPAPTQPFTYAEIDFQKSGSVRTSIQPANKKIRH